MDDKASSTAQSFLDIQLLTQILFWAMKAISAQVILHSECVVSLDLIGVPTF